MAAARAFVALGSNLGDRRAHLDAAVAALGRLPGVDVVAASPVYETAAHTLDPGEAQPPYLNAVVEVRSDLAPEALLAACLEVERAQGRDRRRARRWEARTLDLDLLLYEGETRSTPDLVLPHPRLAERRFVLQPLCDLAPCLHVPAPFDATVADLLAVCPDPDVPARTPQRLAVPDPDDA